PLALNFLPNDLDFPSPGFGNPSTNFVKSRLSRETTPLPLAFIELSAAGEAPLLREGGARRSRCVNAVAPQGGREGRGGYGSPPAAPFLLQHVANADPDLLRRVVLPDGQAGL